MRVADFIFDYLEKKGCNQVFMVSGGQAMYLVDAVCQNTKLHPICMHHEQSVGMCAEAYGRMTGKPGIALVTAGPGSINVLNGVVGGYTDSSPMIVISGQSAYSFVEYQEKSKIRQHGIQGICIRPIVEPVTKYFKTIEDPANILYYLEEAYEAATTGRPGPVWLDVPLNIQGMEVPMKILKEYEQRKEEQNIKPGENIFEEVLEELNQGKRVLLLVGQGVSLGGAREVFQQFCESFQIPVITSRLGIDLIASSDPLFVGRPGNYGDRPANFAVSNADVILSVGSRLSSATVGHDPKSFGRFAKIIAVDLDEKELDKPGVILHQRICCDARVFFKELLQRKQNFKNEQLPMWRAQCQQWKEKYPVVDPSYGECEEINSYYFVKVLSELADENQTILVDTGSCFHVACQGWNVKKYQRFLTTGGLSSMGYWVAGIGACVANQKRSTLVLTGDGSLQMNLQEFATLVYHQLPVKVFIFNNDGYLLIRHTQKNFMEGRLLGEGPDTGVWCPDALALAKAYGIKGVRIEHTQELEEKIKEVLDYEGPVICDVLLPKWQLLIPRVSSDKLQDGSLQARDFDDMFPYLSREELEENRVAQKDQREQG